MVSVTTRTSNKGTTSILQLTGRYNEDTKLEKEGKEEKVSSKAKHICIHRIESCDEGRLRIVNENSHVIDLYTRFVTVSAQKPPRKTLEYTIPANVRPCVERRTRYLPYTPSCTKREQKVADVSFD